MHFFFHKKRAFLGAKLGAFLHPIIYFFELLKLNIIKVLIKYKKYKNIQKYKKRALLGFFYILL